MTIKLSNHQAFLNLTLHFGLNYMLFLMARSSIHMTCNIFCNNLLDPINSLYF